MSEPTIILRNFNAQTTIPRALCAGGPPIAHGVFDPSQNCQVIKLPLSEYRKHKQGIARNQRGYNTWEIDVDLDSFASDRERELADALDAAQARIAELESLNKKLKEAALPPVVIVDERPVTKGEPPIIDASQASEAEATDPTDEEVVDPPILHDAPPPIEPTADLTASPAPVDRRAELKEKFGIRELRDIAKGLNVSGLSKLRTEDALIDAIIAAENAASAPTSEATA